MELNDIRPLTIFAESCLRCLTGFWISICNIIQKFIFFPIRVQINVLWSRKYDPFLIFHNTVFPFKSENYDNKTQYKKGKSFFLNTCWLGCQQNIVYIFNVNQIIVFIWEWNFLPYMLTILTGKSCVLLNTVQEFIETHGCIRHFSYVYKISSIKCGCSIKDIESIDVSRPWKIKFSVMYVSILVFCIICLLTYFHITIFVHIKGTLMQIWKSLYMFVFI